MMIVIEGADGVGKSTVSKELAERIGFDWLCFPDRSTPIGRAIDGYLKDEWRARATAGSVLRSKLNPLVFQGLQLVNRVDKLHELVQYAAQPNCSVVLDRYWQSGYAYGKLDGLDPEYLISLHEWLPKPKFSFLLDAPRTVTAVRLRERGELREHYEQVKAGQRVRDNYLELWATRAGDPAWVVIDAARPQRIVVADIMSRVTSMLRAPAGGAI